MMVGEVQVRTPAGVAPARAGDLVCFPAGAAGAHNIWNERDESARVVMFSSGAVPSVCVYPDGDKVGVWTGSRARPLDVPRGRRAPRVLRRRVAADALARDAGDLIPRPRVRGYPEASMVDPRIYRGFLVVVAFTVIVFGFSLTNQPPPLGTTIAPGQFFTDLTVDDDLARATGRVRGSRARVAGRQCARAPTSISNSRARTAPVSAASASVTTDFSAHTTAGGRPLENVIATRPASAAARSWWSAIATRSRSPGKADLYGTAVMLDLARALSGETLNRSVMLVSTSGQIGAAGATQLATSLAGQQVDAVIVLGDLAGKRSAARSWSRGRAPTGWRRRC